MLRTYTKGREGLTIELSSSSSIFTSSDVNALMRPEKQQDYYTASVILLITNTSIRMYVCLFICLMLNAALSNIPTMRAVCK